MVNTKLITELQELLEKATPASWSVCKTGDAKRIIVGEGCIEGPNGYDVAEFYSDDCDSEEAMANAKLTALFRQHGPEILDRLCTLEEGLQETIDFVQNMRENGEGDLRSVLWQLTRLVK
jgi:hypothetical protein